MKMRRKWKRTVSLLLALCLLAGLLPTTTAFAASDTGKAIQLVDSGTAANFSGGQASSVYFGTYKQSSDGSGGYNTDPIKWRVLSNANGQLFLLSDQNLDVFQYHTDNESVTWETSTMRSWLNGYDASKNTGGSSGTDYSSDNFINTAFSSKEQGAIADTTVVNATNDYDNNANPNPDYGTSGGNNTTDKIFLLSIAQGNNSSYFADSNSRIATNTAYVAGGGKINSNGMESVDAANSWLLRSPGGNTSNAALVSNLGNVFSVGNSVSVEYAVRPALNLNLQSVLFTSAASGGKSATGMNSGLTAVSSYSGSEWKLTLNDSSNRSSFSATFEALTTSMKLVVSYSGAQTGSNEYISALITDSNGAVTYYGRMKNLTNSSDASGTVEIDLSGITIGSGDTLYIFNEQYNGDYMTDYASALIEVAIPTTVNAYDVTNNLASVSTNNTDIYYLINNITDYTATLSATDGYILPDSITVTVGGMALESGSGYTYDSATGILAITATSITGDIIIAVEGVASTYTLTAAAPTFDAVAYGYTQPVAAGITITSTGNTDATITDVSLSGTDGGSFTLNKTDGTTITKGTTDSTTYTIQPAANLDAGTYTTTITVTYNGGAMATADVSFTVNKADQSVSYSESMMTKHINDAAITNTLIQTIGDSTISYTSSDTTVATVNATTGEVTIVGAGSTTITATAASTGNYNEATAFYTLTVTAHSYSEPSFTWSEDGKSCTASFTCTDCNDVQTVTATVISKVKTVATATENGVTIYTATVTFDSVGYTATKELADISATGSTGSDDSDETESTDTESFTDSETTTAEDVAVATISAETGDNSQVVLWLLLLLISGVGIAGIAIYNTKRRRSR